MLTFLIHVIFHVLPHHWRSKAFYVLLVTIYINLYIVENLKYVYIIYSSHLLVHFITNESYRSVSILESVSILALHRFYFLHEALVEQLQGHNQEYYDGSADGDEDNDSDEDEDEDEDNYNDDDDEDGDDMM